MLRFFGYTVSKVVGGVSNRLDVVVEGKWCYLIVSNGLIIFHGLFCF